MLGRRPAADGADLIAGRDHLLVQMLVGQIAIFRHLPVLAELAVVIGQQLFHLVKDRAGMEPLHIDQRRRLEIGGGVSAAFFRVETDLGESFQQGKSEDADRPVRRIDRARGECETRVILHVRRIVPPLRDVIDVVVIENGRLSAERCPQRRAHGPDVTDHGNGRIVVELLAAITTER